MIKFEGAKIHFLSDVFVAVVVVVAKKKTVRIWITGGRTPTKKFPRVPPERLLPVSIKRRKVSSVSTFVLISYPDLPRPSVKQSEIWVRDYFRARYTESQIKFFIYYFKSKSNNNSF